MDWPIERMGAPPAGLRGGDRSFGRPHPGQPRAFVVLPCQTLAFPCRARLCCSRRIVRAQGRAESMDSFLIRGGSRLKGKIEISGSKNSALPILAACLMAEGKTTLTSVPRISDIDSMLGLLRELGTDIYRHEPQASEFAGPAL